MSMTRFDSVSIFPSPKKLLKSNYFMEHLIKVCLVLLLPFLFSGMVAACMIPQIILISYKKRLFDVVDKRKVHEGVIPRLGGVAFVPSIIISYALMVGLAMLWGVGINATLTTTVHLMWGLCALLLLYIEGVTDDLVGVGYKVKFAVQFVCALLVVCSGVWLNNLYGLFGIWQIPWWIGQPLTMLVLVFIINSINLIDGIDGLASGLSIVALFFLACMFYADCLYVAAAICAAMLGALVPFFYFNVFGNPQQHRKIFMGDAGSQVVGLVLGFAAVWFCMDSTQTDYPSAMLISSKPNALVLGFALLMVPCLDVLRVMLGRVRRGCSPFMPDKSHIHHKFLALGMSHRTAMLTIIMIDACFAIINLGLASIVNINLLLLGNIVVWTLMQMWISRIIMLRHKQKEALEKEKEPFREAR